MSKFKQRACIFLIVGLIFFSITPQVGAMHIMEGYLPVTYCVAWGIISLPFIFVGYRKLVAIRKENPQSITLIAMAAAFIFVLSSLKIPSLTGSSSHMTGTGLGAILFGPTPISVLGFIVLLFQAVLLAHGGLTTLGANVFSMAIAGPFVTYGLYNLCKKLNVNKKVAIFIAAMVGDLFTYIVTSGQLALAYPSETGGILASFAKFIGVFAPTQLPLAVIEGLLTVAIVVALESFAKSELKTIGFLREEL